MLKWEDLGPMAPEKQDDGQSSAGDAGDPKAYLSVPKIVKTCLHAKSSILRSSRSRSALTRPDRALRRCLVAIRVTDRPFPGITVRRWSRRRTMTATDLPATPENQT